MSISYGTVELMQETNPSNDHMTPDSACGARFISFHRGPVLHREPSSCSACLFPDIPVSSAALATGRGLHCDCESVFRAPWQIQTAMEAKPFSNTER